MEKRLGYLAATVLALLIAGTRISIQPVSARNAIAPQTEADTDIDPDAMAALTRMGTYLRSLKAFQIESTSTRDEVLDNGQVVTLDKKVNFLVSFPDRLRVEVKSAEQHRLYLYNGKSFTVFAELVNYYATVPAPETVGKLAIEVDEKYGLEIPLEDLFFWGTSHSKEKDITGAVDVGASEIGGVTCEHYAFRQNGLDWQVWIQLGDYPLPRKLVLTTLTDEARPQYSSTLTWNLAPSFNEAAFEFDPPSDAHKINLTSEDSLTGSEK
jgi:hypothetical protein